MTQILFTITFLLAVIGVVWSILPLLPWVVLSLAAMLIVEFGTSVDFSSTTRVIAWVLIGLAIASDYLFPIRGAKYGGWSKAWTRWSIIGMILGFFVPPWWLIIWPLIGAWVWERYVKQDAKHALRAARWSFLWSVGSTVLKLIAAWMVVYWIISAWIRFL